LQAARRLIPNDRLAPILAFVIAALAFAAAYFKICDNDVWWHIRTGEIILDSGRIPRVDPFSHLAAGHY
jgi:hypothetical protein